MPHNRGVEKKAPKLVRHGLDLAGRIVPLVSGSLHYFRLDADAWRPALEQLRALGLQLVDSCVPWNAHEITAGEYDFGEHDRRLNLQGFLKLAQELELLVSLRLGPLVGGELTCLGLPERVVWNQLCQARSPNDAPVVLAAPPLAFPLPSYESEAFYAEASAWFKTLGHRLSELCWPAGPIVMCQIDVRPAPRYSEGLYERDYHPDSLKAYRRFLQTKYGRDVDDVEAEKRFDATTLDDLTPHLDWAEFREWSEVQAELRLKTCLTEAGMDRTLFVQRMRTAGVESADEQGFSIQVIDLQYRANEAERSRIARQVAELSARAEARGAPAHAAELSAGFPAFYPARRPSEDEFNALCSIAYGLTGFNLSMAVQRTRWIGAPIAPDGRAQSSGEFWKRLLNAQARLGLNHLVRKSEVAIVTPSVLIRLARVLHAFGPFSAETLRWGGPEATVNCLEDTLAAPYSPVIETEAFLSVLERGLRERDLPFSHILSQDFERAVQRHRWTVVLCPGGLEEPLMSATLARLSQGRRVTIGPFWPERDGSMQRMPNVPPVPSSEERVLPALITSDPSAIRQAVARVAELIEPQVLVTPKELSLSLLCDEHGQGRVLFVINPSRHTLVAQVSALNAAAAEDALTGEHFQLENGRLVATIGDRSVRMLELVPSS